MEVIEFQLSYFKSWKMMCENAALNMPANLENSAVATGLEKVSFHSNPKERQCQRMLKLLLENAGLWKGNTVQYYEPLSIVLQALCQSDLIP